MVGVVARRDWTGSRARSTPNLSSFSASVLDKCDIDHALAARGMSAHLRFPFAINHPTPPGQEAHCHDERIQAPRVVVARPRPRWVLPGKEAGRDSGAMRVVAVRRRGRTVPHALLARPDE